MPFTSYAQNFEDVILWRVLRDVQNGFYVDVGANHPVEDSVTFAFYLRGWTGINIEPSPTYWKLLADERAKDTNLMVAAGATLRTAVLFDTATRGLASTDPTRISELRHQNVSGIELEVQVVPLKQILKDSGTQEIHFLKIDVEGAEFEVLSGIDLTVARPWVILVEATLPDRATASYEPWEQLITANQYSFVYSDGLNRFYLAEERAGLRSRFESPPNVFDNFISAGHANAIAALESAQNSSERDGLVTEIRGLLTESATEMTARVREVMAQSGMARSQAMKADAEWQRLLQESRAKTEVLSERCFSLTNQLEASSVLTAELRSELLALARDHGIVLGRLDAVQASSNERESANIQLESLSGKVADSVRALEQGLRSEISQLSKHGAVRILRGKGQHESHVELVFTGDEAQVAHQFATVAEQWVLSEKANLIETHRLSAEVSEARGQVQIMNDKVAALEIELSGAKDEAAMWWACADNLERQSKQHVLSLASADSRIQSLNQALSAERIATHNWWSLADSLTAQLRRLRGSMSWRITAPARALIGAVRSTFSKARVLARAVVQAVFLLSTRLPFVGHRVADFGRSYLMKRRLKLTQPGNTPVVAQPLVQHDNSPVGEAKGDAGQKHQANSSISGHYQRLSRHYESRKHN